jgi:hypothetical protein
MTSGDPDLTLVQALKVGQDQALNVLMDRHREGVFRFVFRHVRNEADALELATETFVQVCKQLLSFSARRFGPAIPILTSFPFTFPTCMTCPAFLSR